jgi:hypothetical protein
MEYSRRRVLEIGTGALAAVAGCSAFDDSSDDAVNGSPADDSVELLTFTESVPPEIRDRTRRAYGRTRDIVGTGLTEEITVEVTNPSLQEWSGQLSQLDRYTMIATNREYPTDVLPSAFGTGSGSDIWLAHPDHAVEIGERFDEHFPVDMDRYDLSNIPDGRIIAHELAHAIQYQNWELNRQDGSPDARAATTTVLEGTAEYVGQRYMSNCLDGEYDPCTVVEFWAGPLQAPAWLVGRRLPYVNGMALAHHVVDRGGWDRLIEVHAEPPQTAWAAMFPEQYLDEGLALEEVSQPPAPDGWTLDISTRLGVTSLYEKLAHLDAAWPSDPEAQVSDDLASTAYVDAVYRSSLLEGWRGDDFRVYVDPNQRLAYRWRIAFETAGGADAFAEAIAGGYDRIGSRASWGWQFENWAAAVDRDASAVVLSQAVSPEKLSTVRAPLV